MTWRDKARDLVAQMGTVTPPPAPASKESQLLGYASQHARVHGTPGSPSPEARRQAAMVAWQRFQARKRGQLQPGMTPPSPGLGVGMPMEQYAAIMAPRRQAAMDAARLTTTERVNHPDPVFAPPGIDYSGGGSGVVANDILGQFGPVVYEPAAPPSPPPSPGLGLGMPMEQYAAIYAPRREAARFEAELTADPDASPNYRPVEPPPDANVPQTQDIRFLESNTQLPGDSMTPEQEAEADAALQAQIDQVAAQIDQANTDMQVAYDRYLQDPNDMNAIAYENARRRYMQLMESGEGNQSLIGVIMGLVDTSRTVVTKKMGEEAYKVVTGQTDSYDPGWASIAIGNWTLDMVLPGNQDAGIFTTSLSEDFETWLMDPANAWFIRNAYENGFQRDEFSPRFTGGQAVWELFINGAGIGYKAVMDIALDLATLPAVGSAAGRGATRAGAKAAVENRPMAATIYDATGNVLSLPQRVMDVTVDLPFTVAGDLAAEAYRGIRGNARYGGLFDKTDAVQAEEQGVVIEEALDAYGRGNTSGPARSASPPPTAGGGTTPGGPTQPPAPTGGMAAPNVASLPPMTERTNANGWHTLEYAEAADGAPIFIIRAPDGSPVETLPRGVRKRNDVEPPKENRAAEARLQEYNFERLTQAVREAGGVPPSAMIGRQGRFDPRWEPVTIEGARMKGAEPGVLYRAMLDTRLTPEQKQAFWTEVEPKAYEHARIMDEIRAREEAADYGQGISYERDLVQQGRERATYDKTYERVRFMAEDVLPAWERHTGGVEPPPYQFTAKGKDQLDLNDINSLIEHAVFGTPDVVRQVPNPKKPGTTKPEVVSKGTGTTARRELYKRGVVLPEMGHTDNKAFVGHLGKLGEDIHGLNWRSTELSAVKSRENRARKAGEPLIDDKAVAEATGGQGPLTAEQWMAYLQGGRRPVDTPASKESTRPGESVYGVGEEIAGGVRMKIPTQRKYGVKDDTGKTHLFDTMEEAQAFARGDQLSPVIPALGEKIKLPSGNEVRWVGKGNLLRVRRTGAGSRATGIEPADVQEIAGQYRVYVGQNTEALPGRYTTQDEAVRAADEWVRLQKAGLDISKGTPAQKAKVAKHVEQVAAPVPPVTVAPEPAPTTKPRRTTAKPKPAAKPADISLDAAKIAPGMELPKGYRLRLVGRGRKAEYIAFNKQGEGEYGITPELVKGEPTGRWNVIAPSGELKYRYIDPRDAVKDIERLITGKPATGVGIVAGDLTRHTDLIKDRTGGRVGPGLDDGELPVPSGGNPTDAMLAIGDLTRDQYDLLNRWVDYNGRQMRLYEAYDIEVADVGMEKARERFAMEFIDPELKDRIDARTRSREKRKGWKLLAAYDTALYALRENIMFNWARGWAGVLADTIGNGYILAANGELEATLRLWDPRSASRFIQSERGKQAAFDAMPGMSRHQKVGAGRPPSSVTHLMETRFETGGKRELVLNQQLGKAYHAVRPFADQTIKDVRTAMDRNARYVLYMSTFERELDDALVRFRVTVEERARRLGKNPEEWLAKLDDLGTDFDNRTVAEAFGDNRLARNWAGMVNQAKATGKKRVDELLFSYKSTNADALLRRFAFFHYWMSRAIPLHTKTALRNPWLLNAYHRAWTAMEEDAERNGYPPNVRGFIRLMGDTENGFFGLVNPVNVLVPFNILIENGQDAGTLDFLKRWGLFINPIIEAAAAVMGYSDTTVDPTATRAVRRAVRVAVNWMNANGLDEFVPDTLGEPNTWQTSAFDDFLYGMYEFVNGVLQRTPADVWVREFEGVNPNAYELDVLTEVLNEHAETAFGAPMTQWTEDQWAEYLSAWEAIRLGVDGNDLADGAVEAYADARAAGTAAHLVTPGGLQVLYGPRNRAMAENREGDPDASLRRDMATGGGPEDASLTALDAQYDALADERGWALWKGYNDIAFGDPPGGSEVEIGGEWYSAAEIKAMSPSQREDLANLWLREWDGEAEYEDLKARRGVFLETNPAYGDFKEFQSSVHKYKGGVRKWRNDHAARDSQFAEAMAAERAYQEGRGVRGAALERELDQWASSIAGYKAAGGVQDSLYDDPMDPRSTAPTDLGFAEENIEQPKKTAGTSNERDPVQRLRTKIQRYYDDLEEAQLQLRAAGVAVPDQGLSSHPYYGPLGESVGLPEMTEEVYLYEQWKLAQPPGADTSIDAYIAYLEQLALAA